jgi:hypothetical protein
MILGRRKAYAFETDIRRVNHPSRAPGFLGHSPPCAVIIDSQHKRRASQPREG